MNWYWRARMYDTEGSYLICQIKTGRQSTQFDAIQDFYANVTGCKILLEGMSDRPHEGVIEVREAFARLWQSSAERGDS